MSSELTGKVIPADIDVHKKLGHGLLESEYRKYLPYELTHQGLQVKKQLPLPIIYKEVHLGHGYRIDLLVNNELVLELKTVETLNDVHLAQILTYMRFGGF